VKRIKKCESLLNAEDILNRLMSNPSTKNIDFLVDCYQNGREQGFLLWGFEQTYKAIYFQIIEILIQFVYMLEIILCKVYQIMPMKIAIILKIMKRQ
jgi:hypothetical protein